MMDEKTEKTEKEWRKTLSPEEYRVLREKGTEAPFSGKYWDTHKSGVYKCAACGNELFSSDKKFDSGTGWPSFSAPASEKSVKMEKDESLGTERTEVLCSRCGSHLGHVFGDGPPSTGKRFCINSVALDLEKSDKN